MEEAAVPVRRFEIGRNVVLDPVIVAVLPVPVLAPAAPITVESRRNLPTVVSAVIAIEVQQNVVSEGVVPCNAVDRAHLIAAETVGTRALRPVVIRLLSRDPKRSL